MLWAQRVINLHDLATKYIADEIDDEGLEAAIIDQMKGFIEAKLLYTKTFDMQKHVPGFTSVSAATQMELMLRKRQQATSKHGCQ